MPGIRGSIADKVALVDALESGKLPFAGIDFYSLNLYRK